MNYQSNGIWLIFDAGFLQSNYILVRKLFIRILRTHESLLPWSWLNFTRLISNLGTKLAVDFFCISKRSNRNVLALPLPSKMVNAKQCYYLVSIGSSPDFSRAIKVINYKTLILHLLLYNAETWKLLIAIRPWEYLGEKSYLLTYLSYDKLRQVGNNFHIRSDDPMGSQLWSPLL